MYAKLAAAVTIALALGAITCGAALAEEAKGPVWTLGENIVKENTTVKLDNGTLRFEDTKSSIPVAIECHTSGEGKVKAEGKDEVTTTTAKECITIKGCEAGTITATAVHLPWATALEETEEQTRDKISSGGSGEPGWKVECNVLRIKVIDECTGATSAHVENASGGVEATFDSKSQHLNCSVGGSGAGVASGSVLDENLGESLLQDLPNLGLGAIIPPPGVSTPPMCNFTATATLCTIEVGNVGVLPVLIVRTEIIAPTGRFVIVAPAGCVPGTTQLAASRPGAIRGGFCVDTVEVLNFAVGWDNEYFVRAESTNGSLNTTSMIVRLLT